MKVDDDPGKPVDPSTIVDHVAGSLCGLRARVVAGYGATTVSSAERKGHPSLFAMKRTVGGYVLDCQMEYACEPFRDSGGEDFLVWLAGEMGFRELSALCSLMDAEVHFVLTPYHGLVRMMDGEGLAAAASAVPAPDVPGYMSVLRYRGGLEQETSVKRALNQAGTAAARVCHALANLNPFHLPEGRSAAGFHGSN